MGNNYDVRIRIPGIIPSKKNRMRSWQGRVVKDESVRNAEALIQTQAILAMSEAGLEPFEGPIALEVICFYDDRRRRDAHNVLGSLCDALEGIVYYNDSQIVDLHVSKRLCEKGHSETSVNVWALEEAPDFYPLKVK